MPGTLQVQLAWQEWKVENQLAVSMQKLVFFYQGKKRTLYTLNDCLVLSLIEKNWVERLEE